MIDLRAIHDPRCIMSATATAAAVPPCLGTTSLPAAVADSARPLGAGP